MIVCTIQLKGWICFGVIWRRTIFYSGKSSWMFLDSGSLAAGWSRLTTSSVCTQDYWIWKPQRRPQTHSLSRPFVVQVVLHTVRRRRPYEWTQRSHWSLTSARCVFRMPPERKAIQSHLSVDVTGLEDSSEDEGFDRVALQVDEIDAYSNGAEDVDSASDDELLMSIVEDELQR